MKRIAITALSFGVMSACGGGDYQTIVDACVDGGESKSECSCMANVAKEQLTPEALGKFADLVSEGENAGSEVLENISLADMTTFAAVGIEVSRVCK